MEKNRRVNGLVEYIAWQYRSAVEIGIGHFPDVAYALLNKQVRVFATDLKAFSYAGLDILVDDVTEPYIPLYSGVDVLYSMRTPAELVPFMVKLGKTVHADLIIKPLATEFLGGQLVNYGGTTFYLWKCISHPEPVSGTRDI